MSDSGIRDGWMLFLRTPLPGSAAAHLVEASGTAYWPSCLELGGRVLFS